MQIHSSSEGMCEAEVDTLKMKSNRQRKENQKSTELWGKSALSYTGTPYIFRNNWDTTQSRKQTHKWKADQVTFRSLGNHSPAASVTAPLWSLRSFPSRASVTGGLKWSRWEEWLRTMLWPESSHTARAWTGRHFSPPEGCGGGGIIWACLNISVFTRTELHTTYSDNRNPHIFFNHSESSLVSGAHKGKTSAVLEVILPWATS